MAYYVVDTTKEPEESQGRVHGTALAALRTLYSLGSKSQPSNAAVVHNM